MMNTRRLDLAWARYLCGCYMFERREWQIAVCREPEYQLPAHLRFAAHPEAAGATVWHRIARACRDWGVDPVRYIHWTLSVAQVGLGNPPEPNALIDTARRDAYLRAQPRELYCIWLAMNSQIHSIHTPRFTPGYIDSQVDALATMLVHEVSLASALVRYMLARILLVKFGGKCERAKDIFAAHEQRYERTAMLQYQYHPDAYDCILRRHWMPDGFPDRAADAYDEWLGMPRPDRRKGSAK